MALHLVSSEELRVACRQRLESCELWLRRLVHDQLRKEFGENYIDAASIDEHAIFKTSIRRHVAARLAAASDHRYRRPIDTLQLDHLATVICKPDSYGKFFRSAFQREFPMGSEHLRIVINRLVPIRNALSHANPLTINDAERALCYSSDIISSLTKHYADIGMNQEFDAPMFTRFSDSIGDVEYPKSSEEQINFVGRRALRCGQNVRFEVEVDSHYSPDDYVVKWQVANIMGGESATGSSFDLTLLPKHVNQNFVIFVSVTSRRDWHRHGNHDAQLVLVYTVLPPM